MLPSLARFCFKKPTKQRRIIWRTKLRKISQLAGIAPSPSEKQDILLPHFFYKGSCNTSSTEILLVSAVISGVA